MDQVRNCFEIYGRFFLTFRFQRETLDHVADQEVEVLVREARNREVVHGEFAWNFNNHSCLQLIHFLEAEADLQHQSAQNALEAIAADQLPLAATTRLQGKNFVAFKKSSMLIISSLEVEAAVAVDQLFQRVLEAVIILASLQPLVTRDQLKAVHLTPEAEASQIIQVQIPINLFQTNVFT